MDPRSRARGAALLRELSIGFVPYSPLGHGVLTGHIRSMDDLDDNDWRNTSPASWVTTSNATCTSPTKFRPSPPKPVPRRRKSHWPGSSPRATTSPIPGTKRVTRVEENVAASAVTLSPEQVAKLDNLTPPAGDHHNEQQMQMIDR